MKLSTKGRYGLTAMLDLALNYGEEPVALKNVAERQGISEPYLEQLIAGLRKAGLVKSVRGAQGGYILAYPPDKITVGDVMRVLEGPLAPVDCVIENEPVSCEKADHCVTRIIWEKIRDSINQVVDSITLQDMVDEYNRINGQKGYMYYI
ncbi:MAG: Rrf2 family transcriptional regulator, cysteine metabolism repressor [Clostridiales bacterium]|uniref:Transcriptional regulator, BadM/Rrf2 family n=1 Tax=Mahella australiensis (strain DSM 15567 / CIP 107919 / 50-1 BON) TaxID=697281 RepID=F3ZX90_MAHA5|nr:Rrf2 family transcriptional regulator [Mahella australiensis]AEE96547.1 transcriptional regulator, BadM/Rrf2 family [Mahella australiensis 50-1 BON]MDI3508010.1 Rrf2 family transcriptional regulator, cysteine metabolism repressor [Clostridiales bacterium]MDK2992349.1 Rrf2 family transcriptional regulator, cysteine metabolism repressor [Clostridiales bacterium]